VKAWAALLLVAAALAGAEPLVCRGFPASTAGDAISGRSGRLVLVDPVLRGRDRAVWFALVDDRRPAAAQALAHAVGAWWSVDANDRLHLDLQPRLTPGHQSAGALTSTLVGRLEAERIARRLMDPWLGGSGGLVLDPGTGVWTAVLDDEAQVMLTGLLGLLGSGEARAPHLLPDPSDPGPTRPVATLRATTLGAWAVDLAAASGLAVALGPDCDPAAPAPAWNASTLGEIRQRLAAEGLASAVLHGCLCLSRSRPQDRLHPAQRRLLAQIPVGHLGRTPAEFDNLAARLTSQVQADTWILPGWAVVPVPWTRSLIIAADAPTIHAVMAAIEAIDAAGLPPSGAK
jgi:hypothetical protein